MAARGRDRRAFRDIVTDDVDLLPLMNLFVALIPMLLISAVFLNIAVIDMHAPEDEASRAQSERAAAELALSVTLQAGAYVVEASGEERITVPRSDPQAPARLASALAAIAGRHPANHDIMILSRADTRYEDIVRVMDIARAAGMPGASLLAAN